MGDWRARWLAGVTPGAWPDSAWLPSFVPRYDVPRRGDAKAKGTRRGLTMVSHRAARRFDPTRRHEFPLAHSDIFPALVADPRWSRYFIFKLRDYTLTVALKVNCNHRLRLVMACDYKWLTNSPILRIDINPFINPFVSPVNVIRIARIERWSSCWEQHELFLTSYAHRAHFHFTFNIYIFCCWNLAVLDIRAIRC